MGMETRQDLATQTDASQSFRGEILCVIRGNRYKAADNSSISHDAQQSHFCQDIWQGELHEQSDVQAQMALIASLQHAYLAFEDAGRRPAAFVGLIRAALEAAASANYLASPAIEAVAERARRGLNEMLFGCYQQWRALNNYNQTVGAFEKLNTLNEWLTKASLYPELGAVVRAHESKKSPAAPYVGERRPTISARIDSLFLGASGNGFGQWLYSALSPVAHAESHGFAIASGQILNADGTQTISPEPQMSKGETARFTITCLTGIYQATTSVFNRYGWEGSDIEARCNVALTVWQEVLTG